MTMSHLENLIELKGLDKKELALQLFPTHEHPDRAMNRILSGKSELNSDQILKLASLAGVSPLVILGVAKHEWEQTLHPREYRLTCDDWAAVLSFEEHVTRIYHKGSLYHEEILSNFGLTVREFIQRIELQIAKAEFNQ